MTTEERYIQIRINEIDYEVNALQVERDTLKQIMKRLT